MAEIKSSLEIALARAASMGKAGKDEAAKEEGKAKGRLLARRGQAGELAPGELVEELERLSSDRAKAASTTMAGILLESAPDNWVHVRDLLAVLAPDGEAVTALDTLSRAITEAEGALARLDEDLAERLKAALEAKGIGGHALRPNPQAHPDRESLIQKGMLESRKTVNTARDRCLWLFSRE